MFKLFERGTKCLVMTGAALACIGVVTAGATWQVKPAAAHEKPPARKDISPTVPYWHVWTDEKGVSHQTRSEMSAFKFQSISPGAAPSWIDRQSTPGARVVVLVLPVGWVGEWHENPKPQWIIPLSGRWFVETMDGKRVEMGPGEVSFGGDQNTKPDAQGRKGHRSGTVGDQPAVTMLVQLEKDPFVGQPRASRIPRRAQRKPSSGQSMRISSPRRRSVRRSRPIQAGSRRREAAPRPFAPTRNSW